MKPHKSIHNLIRTRFITISLQFLCQLHFQWTKWKNLRKCVQCSCCFSFYNCNITIMWIGRGDDMQLCALQYFPRTIFTHITIAYSRQHREKHRYSADSIHPHSLCKRISCWSVEWICAEDGSLLLTANFPLFTTFFSLQRCWPIQTLHRRYIYLSKYIYDIVIWLFSWSFLSKKIWLLYE